MTIIISIVIFLILTMQTFFLGGTVWLGIVGMLLSAAGVVLSFVLKIGRNILVTYRLLRELLYRLCAVYLLHQTQARVRFGKKRYFWANGQCRNSGERRRKIC